MEFIKDVVVAFDEPDLFVPVIQLIFVDGGEFDSVGIVGKLFDGECQDFCVWGGYSRGSPTRLPFVFCDAVCQT